MKNVLIVILVLLALTAAQNHRGARRSRGGDRDDRWNNTRDWNGTRDDNAEESFEDGRHRRWDGPSNNNPRRWEDNGSNNGPNEWKDNGSNDTPRRWEDNGSNDTPRRSHQNLEDGADITWTESRPKSDSSSSSSRSSKSNSASTSSSTSSSRSSSNSSSTSTTTTSTEFSAVCLEVHNKERNALGLNSLTWNIDLAAAAKKWADHLASVGSLSHSPDSDNVGENVGYRSWDQGVDTTPQLIQDWLDEKEYFKNGRYPDVSTTGDDGDVGHYTQCVWRTTTQVGCGLSRSGDRDYLVCQYDPAGNWVGEKVY